MSPPPKSTQSPPVSVGPTLTFQIEEQPVGTPLPAAGTPLDLSANPTFAITDLAKDGKRLDAAGHWDQALVVVEFSDPAGAPLTSRAEFITTDASGMLTYTPHPPVSGTPGPTVTANLTHVTHRTPTLYVYAGGIASREFKSITATVGTTAKLAPSTRLRNSMFCAPHNLANPSYLARGSLNDQNIAGGDGVIDDILLLNTICNQNAKTPGTLDKITSTGQGGKYYVDFDPLVLNPHPPYTIEVSDPQTFAKQKRFYADLIAATHARHIQILAGYNLARANSAGASTFNAWVTAIAAAPSRMKEVGELAQDIVDFLTEHFPGPTDPAFGTKTTAFDGICFDIEIIGMDIGVKQTGLHLAEIDKRGAVMTAFYQAVASRLAMQDKYVGVANGGLITPYVWGPRPTSTGNFAMASAIAQPYKMALGAPNLVLQPQCYDSGLLDTQRGPKDATSDLWDWHHRIIDYALGTVGLHPSQLQLSIKTVPGQIRGEVTNPNRVAQRCAHLLRPNRVGIARFAMGPEKGTVDTSKDPPTVAQGNFDFGPIAVQDRALNPDPNRPGHALPTHTAGQPHQVPMTAQQAANLAAGKVP